MLVWTGTIGKELDPDMLGRSYYCSSWGVIARHFVSPNVSKLAQRCQF